jgi:hypothetical protein
MRMTRLKARESWLGGLTACVGPRFSDAGYPLPAEVRLSCGWPKPGGGGIRHPELQGTTWFSAADGVAQILVSPALIDPLAVAITLVHELTHVAAGQDAKQGRLFQAIAQSVGLCKPLEGDATRP